MDILTIDIETFSDIDLRRAGVYSYVESIKFEILLLAYKFNSDPTRIIDLTKDNIKDSFISLLTDETIIKTAYNANFERVCLSKFLKIDLPINQWRCTAVHASVLGLPNNLKDVAKILKLESQKDIRGTRLINYFSIPCNKTKTNGWRERNLPEHDIEKWEEFKRYCIQDVEVEFAIRKRLSRYAMTDNEQELYEIDQIINDRGVRVDKQLILNAIEFNNLHSINCFDKFEKLTGGLNATSSRQIKSYLISKNIDTDSTDRASILRILDSSKIDDETREVLKLKLDISKTSIKKYESMKRCICDDGRIRGLMQFYGANRTGRWAGRLVQIHNLPQNHLNNIEIIRNLVCGGDYELFNMLYEDISSVLSQLIRTAFIPSEGKKFIVCDFSAIEARIISFLANERWRIDVFNTHGKIYEASASKMFKIPIESITKSSSIRQKGKIAELSLGYGGGVQALKQMGALNMGIENEEELFDLVCSWRKANPNIVNFWREVERAAIQAVKGKRTNVGKIIFETEGRVLFISLLSGRRLAYLKPKIVLNRFGKEAVVYEGINGTSKIWGKIETYGGKLAENIVQAIARDCLAESIKRLHKRGYDIVFHVHDEIVVEVNKDVKVSDIEIIMSMPISWAKDLYLTVSGFETLFYKKE